MLQKTTNYFEIHCPREFTPERPAFNFTTDNAYINTPISQHPTGKHLPRSSDLQHASILQGDENDVLTLCTRENFPASARDIAGKDVPLMSLHVVPFLDAAVVGFSWSHLQADGSGISALLHSWSLIMSGKDAEVPSVDDAKVDKLTQLDQLMAEEEASGTRQRVAEEDIVIEKERQGWFGLSRFIAGMIWQNATQPAWERRFIYMPKSVRDKIVKLAQEEAAAAQDTGHSNDTLPLNVSTGDALTAWFTKLLTPPSNDISVVQYVNLRYRFPSLGPFTKSWSADSKVQLQNMVVPSHIRVPSSVVSINSTGVLAREMKRQMVQQMDQNQLMALVRKLKKEIYPGVQLLTLYGPLSDSRILVNNVIVMNLIRSAMFAPAVIKEGEKDKLRANPPGSMVGYMLYRFVRPAPSGMHSLLMIGEDHAGGHYFYVSTPKERFDVIQKELDIIQAGDKDL